MKRILYLTMLLVCVVQTLYAQSSLTVSGKIISETGEQMPGVSIGVKGTATGTTTNADGTYSLPVPNGDAVLVISFIGYTAQEVAVKNQTTINVTLQPDAKALEEVIVTGYQTERKADLTGAVAVVKMDQIKDNPTPNVMQSLQGQVPGLYIKTDGSPNPKAEVRIRGTSTLGNSNPLYVIDGVPSTSGMQYLNPNDIESVQVLKDGSSASIYGARASNGVIIVTTKKAKAGQMKVDYSTSLATERFANKLQMLNTQQRGQALWQAAVNDGIDPDNAHYKYTWHREPNGQAVLDNITTTEWLDQAKGIKAGNTNWFNEISRPGFLQTHDVSLSNGSEKGGIRFSLNYYGNNGIVKGSEYDRITGRVNSHYNLLKGKLTVGENLSVSKATETPMPSGIGGTPLALAIRALPILPIYTVDGRFAGPAGGGFSDRDNPLAVIEDNKADRDHTAKVFGNVYANYTLLPNLNFRTNFGLDYESLFSRNVTLSYQRGFLSNPVNALAQSQQHAINWTWNNVLTYQLDRQFHSASFMAGMESVNSTNLGFSASREKFALQTDDYFYLDAGTGNRSNSGFSTGFSLLSYFGKASYTFKEKYLASATLRYDGSSRFGEKNKFGLFPAFSAGWRLSNEDFFRNNLPVISDLKLRAGWGRTGNQQIADYATFALYRPNYGDDQTWAPSNGTAYDINGRDGGTLPSGYYATQTANDRLRWESTAETNLGLDFGLLDQKLFGSFEYFIRDTKDILIQPAFIGVIGDGGAQWMNGASMRNKGFEMMLGYRSQTGSDFNYEVSGNVGAFRDRITQLPEEVLRSYPGNVEKNILGHSVRSMFGYVADGIFQNAEQVSAHAEQPGKAVGRLRFKDLNNDGVINTLDQDYIGVANPAFEYGLNSTLRYKNLDLNVFFQGVQGIEVNTASFQIYSDFTSIWNGENSGVRTLEAWTPQNPNATIPALSLTDKNNERRVSTYFINNGSYLKLRNVQLGYTIPKIGTLPIENVRVYLRGDNLLTFKDTKGANRFVGPDPETPNDQYPRPTRLTVGLNVSF